jgi:hypothetical protein
LPFPYFLPRGFYAALPFPRVALRTQGFYEKESQEHFSPWCPEWFLTFQDTPSGFAIITVLNLQGYILSLLSEAFRDPANIGSGIGRITVSFAHAFVSFCG